MWVLVENFQYPLYLYDFSPVWIVWWLVTCDLWLKAFAQAWHFTVFSWLNSLIYCKVWVLTEGFSTSVPLRVLLWNEMLAVLLQKRFAHQLPWWSLSRVTSGMCCKVGALAESFLTVIAPVRFLSWVSPDNQQVGILTECLLTLTVYVGTGFLSTVLFDIHWEPSVPERSSHIQNIHAVPLPCEWTAADCALWGHWSLIHPYHTFRASLHCEFSGAQWRMKLWLKAFLHLPHS